MDAEFIREAINAGGVVTTRHNNGTIYHLTSLGKMQVDGEWFECVNYHCTMPLIHRYCRKITDFEKFNYLYNETYSGFRGIHESV